MVPVDVRGSENVDKRIRQSFRNILRTDLSCYLGLRGSRNRLNMRNYYSENRIGYCYSPLHDYRDLVNGLRMIKMLRSVLIAWIRIIMTMCPLMFLTVNVYI